VPKGEVVNPETRKIGWIGTGVCGNNMCYQLVRQGYDVTINDINPKKCMNLVGQGATFEEN